MTATYTRGSRSQKVIRAQQKIMDHLTILRKAEIEATDAVMAARSEEQLRQATKKLETLTHTWAIGIGRIQYEEFK